MLSKVEIRNKIIQLFQSKKGEKEEDNIFREFKNILEENNAEVRDFDNSDFDILILAIDKSLPNKIIRYIIEQGNYDTFNYTFNLTQTYIDYFRFYPDITYQVPLFLAIFMHNYEIANVLLKKKKS